MINEAILPTSTASLGEDSPNCIGCCILQYNLIQITTKKTNKPSDSVEVRDGNDFEEGQNQQGHCANPSVKDLQQIISGRKSKYLCQQQAHCTDEH